jgi:hypothetical protein
MQFKRDKAQETGWQKVPDQVPRDRDIPTEDERKASALSGAGFSLDHLAVKTM